MDKHLKRNFIGVFACDRLPTHIKRFPTSLICNTAPSSDPGRHWVAFYFKDSRNVEYFDSYGRAPDNMYFLNFINRNVKHYDYSEKPLQSFHSDLCGEYCIYYLLQRSRNVSQRKFLRKFSNNRKLNDEKLVKFINKYKTFDKYDFTPRYISV
jgi:hypothetical protein